MRWVLPIVSWLLMGVFLAGCNPGEQVRTITDPNFSRSRKLADSWRSNVQRRLHERAYPSPAPYGRGGYYPSPYPRTPGGYYPNPYYPQPRYPRYDPDVDNPGGYYPPSSYPNYSPNVDNPYYPPPARQPYPAFPRDNDSEYSYPGTAESLDNDPLFFYGQ